MINSEEYETSKINNGPRVSFNRDVHVKRYGSLLNNEILNYDSNSRSQSPNLRREFVDLTDSAALEREAALVLKQVNNYGSLPLRKQQQHLKKPLLRRSKSDASSSKKSRRNSIFNFFNSNSLAHPSPTNLISQINNGSNVTKKSNTNNNGSNKKVRRSKSDISNMQRREKYRSKVQLNSNSFNGNFTSSDSSDNNNVKLANSFINKVPLSPITEVNTPLETSNSNDYFSKQIVSNTSNHDPFKSCEDVSDNDQKKNSNVIVHSSQMPVEKPLLTKNKKVNKIVKQLSMERPLSPPIGGFSYTNPPQLSSISPVTLSTTNNKLKTSTTPSPLSLLLKKTEQSNNSNVVYTQLAYNEINADDKSTPQRHETVQNTYKRENRESASPIFTPKNEINDQFINLAPTPVNYTDLDETDNIVSIVTENEEPIITPKIRKQPPLSKFQQDHIDNFYLDKEFDHLHEMRETDFNGIDASLSSRREILESRIKSRIDGLQQINNEYHHNTTPTTKPPEHEQHHEFVKSSSSMALKYDQINNKMINMDNDSFKKNSFKYNDKTIDSGNETDNVTKNNYRNRRYSSRFNIGRKWNYEDDIIECELFLMKERKHTEETYPYQLVRTYVYRQRSDNDDQYDTDQDKNNILKEWKHNKKMTREFLKTQKKKKSGLEKVKELFKSKKSNDKNEENELKLRYHEYSPEKIEPPQKASTHQSIINRRRLSTPQASPIIPNRSKSLPPKVANPNYVASKQENENNAQKFNWFTSLERLSRRKNRDSDVRSIDRKTSISRSKSTSMKNVSLSNGSNKTLRFFGDTDADENDSVQRTKSNEAREKSSSLQNLNSNRRTRQSKSISRSRQELLNIAESTSDEQNIIEKTAHSRPVSPILNKFLPPPRPPKSTKLVSSVSSTLPRTPLRKKYDFEDETEYQDSLNFYQKKNNYESEKNFSTPRRMRESLSVNRENLHRDRFDSDASQRSVVYLHASVVGDIPSQTLGRKMSGKSSMRTAYKEEQPITRTVDRTFSLAAPWKPKFISDGYEINYNNDQQKNIN
ncbi:hypothetical protein PVAND_003693 [Polypedilum vanderplanki]|uniref:Uncharacterized protein n=1 Tax=Polypedilum vanderplanki TaxID=319348 RepID=A0A9J6BVC5_POLVA|nr:hypothetical protein PVAND_003693 [Polypedilum vanderplanki]